MPVPAPMPVAASLVKCAVENGTCNVSTQSAVVYGKNSTWIGMVANAPSIACNNATVRLQMV